MKIQAVTQNTQGLRLGTSNPHRLGDWHRGAAWASRTGYLANLLKGRHPDFIGTQEQGSQTMADQLAAAYSKVCGGTYSAILGGDEWDISQALIYRSDQFVAIAHGQLTMVPSAPGHSHNKGLWVELEHRTTGEQIMPIVLHLISGHTPANIRDRGKQVADLTPQIPAIAKDVPVLVLGDVNQAREENGDPVGKAFAKAGYLDAEASPCAVVNPKYNSSNDLHNPPYRASHQIDRHFGNPKQLTFTKREIIVNLDSRGNHRTPWPADHQPVLTESVTRV